MSRKMLIDAGHPEETRVVVTDRSRVIDFDFETESKQPLRGNIYLAKVTRVEPSLQAAFVEYGGNRHGFLAFNEIHPDYYQLPHEDRQALIEEESRAQSEGDGEDADEDPFEDAGRARRSIARRYKIQEVIKRRQILLVQVVKEERGNKGAALTTYLSLAGRYCVLMPNTARGGGISRKITNGVDRKKLKTTVQSLEVPKGMGLIVRTAGAQRTKTEIKRDYEYLLRLWERIREQTLESIAPTMIYEEGNLVRRAVRDLYDKDIDEVLVEGDAAYREAKDFMRMLMPSHAKKVQPYKDKVPLFLHHKVEPQLDAIYEPVVSLPSGGYLVINATEALVAIDVNSGKATRERNIEATALRTNMEAAEEAARQMRLRDLAGLVVIDFIDMEEGRNNRSVEKKMKEALRFDRARVQTSKISGFGLMEISRQRRRSSLLEGSTIPCPHCSGRGYIRSTPSSALSVLRAVEEKGARQNAALLQVSAPSDVVIYILNTKREHLRAIEERYTLKVAFTVDNELMAGEFEVEQMAARTRELDDDRSEPPALAGPSEDTRASADAIDVGEDEDGDAKKPRRRRRRKRRGEGADTGADNAETADAIEVIDTDAAETGASEIGDTDGETRASEDEDEDKPKRRRRRGRRGGRRRRDGADADGAETESGDTEAEARETAAETTTDTETDAGSRPEDDAEPNNADADPEPAALEGPVLSVEVDVAPPEPTVEADTPALALAEDAREVQDVDVENVEAQDSAPEPDGGEPIADNAETAVDGAPETAEPSAEAEPATAAAPAEPLTEVSEATDDARQPAQDPGVDIAEAAQPLQSDNDRSTAADDGAEPSPQPEDAADQPDGKPRKKGWWQRSGLFGVA